MNIEFRREYQLRLPLPIAKLYNRAYNDKDARSRHNNAYYLFEALIKLAASPLIMAYLAAMRQDGVRVDAMNRLLVQLALPSLGQWLGILRELARYYGALPEATSHPLGHLWGQLTRPHRDRPGLLALYRRLKNGPDGQPGADQHCSVLQLMDVLVPYRNEVFGHGAERVADFYAHDMGPLLFMALNDVLAEGVLDLLGPPGTRLIYMTDLRILTEDRHELTMRELFGLAGERLAPLPLSADETSGLAPRHIAVLWPGHRIPLRLDPLLQLREREEGDDVLFLNRDRNGRQVEYLSYSTGRTERDKEMVEALAALLATVTGRPVTEAHLDELAAQSLAETPSVERLLVASSPVRRWLGDYEILAEIGRGGMGVVYLARQLSLGRIVALKTLPADLLGDEVTLARFRREMRALARCDHPHIVKLLDSGTLPDGQIYYTMEYVPGSDLEQVWRELPKTDGMAKFSDLGQTTFSHAAHSASAKKRQEVEARYAQAMQATLPTQLAVEPTTIPQLPLPPLPALLEVEDDPGGYTRRVVTLIRDAALALQAVHEQQIVHRDIKPANLMLTPDGTRIVLMDFGLVKGQSLALSLSQAGGFLGTLRYAAPEQLAAAMLQVGPQADVRGLGVTLWELLTRRRLFDEADDELQLASKIHDEDVPLLRQSDPSFDRDLEAIVARATERRTADRLASAGQLAEYLQLYLDGKSLPIRPPSTAELVRRWMREHQALVSAVVAAALVLTLTVVIAFIAITRAKDDAVAARDDATHLAQRNQELAESAEKATAEAERKRDEAHRSESVALGAQSASASAHGRIDVAFQLASKGLPRLWSQPDRPVTDASLQAFFRAQAGLASRKENIVERLPHHGSNLTAVKISPNGKHVATAAWDATVRIWDSTSLENIATMRWDTGPADAWFCRIITSVDISPDGASVATANLDGQIRLWEWPNDVLVHELTAATGNANCSKAKWGNDLRPTILSVRFDPTGDFLVSTAADGAVAIWDTRGGNLMARYHHATRVNAAVFDRTRQNSIILIDNDGLLRVYNFRDKVEVLDVPTSGSLFSLTLSGDGKRVLATSSDGTARLLEIRTDGEIRKFVGHSHWVTSGAFGPNDAWVATGSDDGTIRLWDIGTGATFATLSLGEQITGIAVAQDTGTVFIATLDGKLHVWTDDPGLRTVNTGQAVSIARARFNHSPWDDQSLLLDPERMRGSFEGQTEPSVDLEFLCTMADDPDDPERTGPGIESYRLHRQSVLEVCNAAIAKAPGNGRYHYNVGRVLAAQGDFSSAEKQYRGAIDRGSWIAAAALADMLRTKYVASHTDEIVKLLKSASEHGVGVASWRLAGMLWRGELVTRDKAKSIEMGLKAAMDGVPDAHVWLAQNIEATTQKDWLAQALFHYTVAAELYEKRKDFFNAERQHENRARTARVMQNEVVADAFEKAISWGHSGSLPRESLEFAKVPDRVSREPNEKIKSKVYEDPRLSGRTLDGCLKSSLSARMFDSDPTPECSAKAQREIASHFCRTQGYAAGHGKRKDMRGIQQSVKLVIEPRQALELNFIWAPDNRGGFIFTEITCQ